MKRVSGATLAVATANSQAVNYDVTLDLFDKLAVQLVYTDATPAAKTFADANVNTTTDRITITTHGFVTGLKVAATNSGGALPGGTSATNYWIIVVDANTVKLASSLANAVAGTAVDITSAAGGGTHTLTPATLSQAVKLQSSNDGTNFEDYGSYTVSITSAGTKVWDLGEPAFRILRIVVTPTAGALTLSAVLNAKAY